MRAWLSLALLLAGPPRRFHRLGGPGRARGIPLNACPGEALWGGGGIAGAPARGGGGADVEGGRRGGKGPAEAFGRPSPRSLQAQRRRPPLTDQLTSRRQRGARFRSRWSRWS